MIKTANTQYDIHDLLKDRWSPRMFDERIITSSEMNLLLEAARWAPSSGNIQPWRFIYAHKGSDNYQQIIDCLSDFNQEWVKNAAVLMVTAYKEKTPKGLVNFHGPHDLGLAMGNMSLQAQSMGIAIHQMAGIDWKKAQEVFHVPDGYHITTAVAIGYYGGDTNKLPDDLKETELSPRKRNEIYTFAAEGKWPG